MRAWLLLGASVVMASSMYDESDYVSEFDEYYNSRQLEDVQGHFDEYYASEYDVDYDVGLEDVNQPIDGVTLLDQLSLMHVIDGSQNVLLLISPISFPDFTDTVKIVKELVPRFDTSDVLFARLFVVEPNDEEYGAEIEQDGFSVPEHIREKAVPTTHQMLTASCDGNSQESIFDFPALVFFPASRRSSMFCPRDVMMPLDTDTVIQRLKGHGVNAIRPPVDSRPGCSPELDALARDFAASQDDASQREILVRARATVAEIDRASATPDPALGRYYLKLMARVHEHGFGYLDEERHRLMDLTDPNCRVSSPLKRHFKLRMNILDSFARQP